MFSSPEKEDGPIAGGALLNVFGNDRPPSVKRPNTWWASSRSETKSATSDEAKSPMAFGNIFSNFGSTVQKPASTTSAAPPAPQSTATGAAARTRGRPSSVGFDFTSKRTSTPQSMCPRRGKRAQTLPLSRQVSAYRRKRTSCNGSGHLPTRLQRHPRPRYRRLDPLRPTLHTSP
ncbi:hypothetical protein BC831DRAFT_188987 [Entophlyctis helioformis]|nr:hypothetical protein BC831DRAFT_188987 [Entophlyctis helioformis]